MLNRSGPKTEPWGTPLVTGRQLDLTPFTTTLWARPSSQFFTQQSPVLHPVHCEPVHPTVGQFVQKDAVRDSIKSLTKTQKNYIHYFPFIH
ncbi:unnamed protein product [Bubo scandiacus]